jgi:signal transduction histidine kinase
VFQNLLGNSIKYRSAEPPKIHVNARKLNGFYEFGVADNGIGVDPEHHDRIFGVFKRLHGKEVPGTGIGLAICRKIIESHGGRIWVESEPGKGATFKFTLPAHE